MHTLRLGGKSKISSLIDLRLEEKSQMYNLKSSCLVVVPLTQPTRKWLGVIRETGFLAGSSKLSTGTRTFLQFINILLPFLVEISRSQPIWPQPDEELSTGHASISYRFGQKS
ncbi:hypothetical protein Osc7112_2083 [Oscillatoria nigro-viridis PCC 7112]|uniref:Uncharacterized protein n=1 Tax=Phormidium nigroviride PCC 7112 TaxID=179408 RepID=K9VGF4_9CYAN|nr:hypothetical protein Osc7112_2083 [Oscillatoria nigro-viridis PCC 7112]